MYFHLIYPHIAMYFLIAVPHFSEAFFMLM